METESLASKLGTTPHLSALLRKARRLGLDADGLEYLALRRGCDYYGSETPLLAPDISVGQFSNAELAIALLNPSLRYRPQTLRLGAAMLGAEDNVPEEIARLAKWERCEAVVRYIAECGRDYEPYNGFWSALLKLIPQTRAPKTGVLPHPSRFVAMTGFTRHGAETVSDWIRPRSHSPAHG